MVDTLHSLNGSVEVFFSTILLKCYKKLDNPEAAKPQQKAFKNHTVKEDHLFLA
ncbi:hypothetical protein [Wolbachia endosymbiont of Aedes albopictus]|uniref:hypothetical protein n=1 Tax=Wolbachia endosymbiont of Aedes albopictus TaxID=167957 RepID=UPI002166E2AB|nr:hypothetical protein [Wolbachia endosymbiont of Aedes albopictus]UVW84524.1 hypothetical protein NHG98_06380 [Wolbachia endosymbiont of Aedes albopictus]